MATDHRQTPPDLNVEMGFFELLRQLEQPGRRLGREANPATEPARLGQPLRLSFASGEVARIDPPATPGGPAHIAVNVIGLFGPEGPMPLHLTRWMMERASNRWFTQDGAGRVADTAFLDFCNLMQHRMIAYFWRAWADQQPVVQARFDSGGPTEAMLRALAGIGLPGAASGHAPLDTPKIMNATGLANVVQSPDRLTRYLKATLGMPVSLREFVGRWDSIPMRLQTRIGKQAHRLGSEAVIGKRHFSRQGLAELTIGPLPHQDYLDFVNGGAAHGACRHAIRYASDPGINFDLRVELDSKTWPGARLGEAQLGRSAWLGKLRQPAVSDFRIKRISASDPKRRAA